MQFGSGYKAAASRAAALALILSGVLAASASAAPSPCSLISKTTFAKIVGLAQIFVEERETYGENQAEGPDHEAVCEFYAWSGKKPSRRNFSARLASGTFASLEIRTFFLEPLGPQPEWEEQLHHGRVGIKSEFDQLHLSPKLFTPPTFGADVVAGTVGSEGATRFDRALWASISKRSEITVTLVHANKNAATVRQQLIQAAAVIVPADGI